MVIVWDVSLDDSLDLACRVGVPLCKQRCSCLQLQILLANLVCHEGDEFLEDLVLTLLVSNSSAACI